MYGAREARNSARVGTKSTFISSRLAGHLSSHTTVSSALASAPDEAVHVVAESLYGKKHGSAHHDLASDQAKEGHNENDDGGKTGGLTKVMEKLHLKKTKTEGEEDSVEGVKEKHDKDRKNPAADQWVAMRPLNTDELEEVEGYGKWGDAKPSELFLNALLTLEEYPLNGMVSPALMGSCGVVPLSIVSVIPDIIQHHADMIVRAEHEIFLATNYWEASGAAETIVDAIKELSRRVQARGGARVVFKLMYDRGNPSQLLHPHQPVPPETYTDAKVKLPHPDDIPGVDLEVQNYHEPPVGTFHAKYMVVDRKVAILNSNNIQDRVNVEMMTHIEGPIVQSIYDLALLSWSLALSPPLPLLTRPPSYPSNLSRDNFVFGKRHPLVEPKGDLRKAGEEARRVLGEHHRGTEVVQEQEAGGDGAEDEEGERGGEAGASGAESVSARAEPSDEADVGEGKKGEVWDQTNEAEARRVDGQFGSEATITQHLNTGTKISGTDTDVSPDADAFTPIILHSPHDPVPMALVCRAPRGKPGHGDTYVPQDQAWLAAFKFAKRNVFVQTPTFNATPVVEAALEAVRRGVLVEIYADLGFNDEGELLPYQGGTNEMVASYMYDHLTEKQKSFLRIYWYTGKDQKTPLNAKDKSRNCHVKLMIADEALIIQGNGNQDTQSWFHSQEVNVMTDSPLLASEIRRGVDANQNTKRYGLVDSRDGVWRDKQGRELPGQKKPPRGPFKSLVGVQGAVQRVRGEGGF